MISELEGRVRRYHEVCVGASIPDLQLKGLLMSTLPPSVKTHMSQHAMATWPEYRAKVLEYVYLTTSGPAPMVQGCEKAEETAKDQQQSPEDWWAKNPQAQQSQNSDDLNGMFQKDGGGKAGIQCYGCGQFGHRKNERPSKGKGKSGGEKGGKGKGFHCECYTCGQFGHSARNCPKGKGYGKAGGGGFQGKGKGINSMEPWSQYQPPQYHTQYQHPSLANV